MTSKRIDIPQNTKAKKSLGQNFLVDEIYVGQIIDAVDPTADDTIVEIGPGHGALTRKLVTSGANVIAVELDQRLIEPLRQEFAGNSQFQIFERDALNTDFAELLAQSDSVSRQCGENVAKLAANLPYYISTAILQRLAEQRHLFSSIVLMFQREVVDRIAAKPGDSERGFLTVLTESAFSVEKLFYVPPTAFRPVPKVWSAVVRLTPKAKQVHEEQLKQLLSVGFAHKRKTISNNLRDSYSNYQSALERSGIDSKLRAEDLSLDDWLRLNQATIDATI